VAKTSCTPNGDNFDFLWQWCRGSGSVERYQGRHAVEQIATSSYFQVCHAAGEAHAGDSMRCNVHHLAGKSQLSQTGGGASGWHGET